MRVTPEELMALSRCEAFQMARKINNAHSSAILKIAALSAHLAVAQFNLDSLRAAIEKTMKGKGHG